MSTKCKENRLITLFFTFIKIGAFTFGGGYAMIPLIQKEIVEKHKWIEEQEIIDMIAIAESTPGPIAINMATFVGFQAAGVGGAFLATCGVVLPSFLIIFMISFFLRQFEHLQVIKYAFNGIRVGVLVLILKALLSMFKQCPHDKMSYLMMLGVFLLATGLDVNILFIIIGCALIGLAVTYAQAKRGEKR